MKPYFQDEAVTIYHGDCREILPYLPQVDFVVTSPPFNLGNTHHTGDIRHSAYPDNMPEREYQKWQVGFLDLLYDRVDKHGSAFYHHKNRITGGISISPYQWLLQTKWLIKQEIVWFNGSQNFDKCRFYPMTERIYWLAKNPETKLVNKANKHDLWHMQAEGTDGQHTRAFPETLVKTILACFPDAGLVLDPFMGSGTTLRAAKDLGRKAIGIEIEEKYCEIAAKRMSQMCFDLQV